MSHSGRSIHFIEDQDVPPMAYAEQFADPDPSKALPPEELLRQARLIISTQLGADPLLRRHVRDLYKNFAQVSVSPTEKGKSKIDEYHTYYVSMNHNGGRCLLAYIGTGLQILAEQAHHEDAPRDPVLAYPKSGRGLASTRLDHTAKGYSADVRQPTSRIFQFGQLQ